MPGLSRPASLTISLLATSAAIAGCGNGPSDKGDGYSPAVSASPADAAGRPPAKARAVACPRGGRQVRVRDGSGLRRALAHARPGTVIRMADGEYRGEFAVTRSGTRKAPSFLCGSRAAVLDGEGEADYVLHVDGAAWWRLAGFSVRGGKKGVMADRARHDVISGLFVSGIGDEAIHLRTFSTDNRVVANRVRDTGNRRDTFGEGIYVGSAHSNWCTYTDCKPDASNRNAVVGNDIAQTTAEGIDIKEGTVDGVVARNSISGAGMTDSDSFIDAKGNGWLIVGNRGTDSPEDGIQTHVNDGGWGMRNVIRGNRLVVNGSGYGIYIHDPETSHNVVRCDNVVRGAKQGYSNTTCRDWRPR